MNTLICSMTRIRSSRRDRNKKNRAIIIKVIVIQKIYIILLLPTFNRGIEI